MYVNVATQHVGSASMGSGGGEAECGRGLVLQNDLLTPYLLPQNTLLYMRREDGLDEYECHKVAFAALDVVEERGERLRRPRSSLFCVQVLLHHLVPPRESLLWNLFSRTVLESVVECLNRRPDAFCHRAAVLEHKRD
jgi:hypothetical protein